MLLHPSTSTFSCLSIIIWSSSKTVIGFSMVFPKVFQWFPADFCQVQTPRHSKISVTVLGSSKYSKSWAQKWTDGGNSEDWFITHINLIIWYNTCVCIYIIQCVHIYIYVWLYMYIWNYMNVERDNIVSTFNNLITAMDTQVTKSVSIWYSNIWILSLCNIIYCRTAYSNGNSPIDRWVSH